MGSQLQADTQRGYAHAYACTVHAYPAAGPAGPGTLQLPCMECSLSTATQKGCLRFVIQNWPLCSGKSGV